MSGEAKSSNFLLGSATVMVGAQADLFNLNPTDHSIGLVKNFTLSSEPSYVQLTQGVKNTIVDSALTSNPVRATMEVFEATAKNINYGLGLDGSTLSSTGSTYHPNATIAAAATTFVIAGSDVTSTFTAGSWVMIKEGDDKVHIAKVASSAFSTNTTVTFTGYAVPAGVSFTTAANITKVVEIGVGSKVDQPYLSAKVVGLLSNGEPITMLFPKLRVVKGFSLAFTTENYGNLPFEFTPYEMTSSDGNYGKLLASGGVVAIYRGVA